MWYGIESKTYSIWVNNTEVTLLCQNYLGFAMLLCSMSLLVFHLCNAFPNFQKTFMLTHWKFYYLHNVLPTDFCHKSYLSLKKFIPVKYFLSKVSCWRTTYFSLFFFLSLTGAQLANYNHRAIFCECKSFETCFYQTLRGDHICRSVVLVKSHIWWHFISIICSSWKPGSVRRSLWIRHWCYPPAPMLGFQYDHKKPQIFQ